MRSILRTILLSTLAAAVVLSAGYLLLLDVKDRRIRELEAIEAEMRAIIAQKEAMIERLGRSRRVAHIEVLDQTTDPATGRIGETRLEFIEMDDRGKQLGRQKFTIPGEMVFIDCWTVKFRAEDVAHGHPLRGRTLILFRSLFSERMAPKDGLPIDTPGSAPTGYAGSEPAIYEQRIWQSFWDIAANPALAQELGVRIAQGEVVYQRVKAGEAYELIVDAAGGMNFRLIPRSERIANQPG